jgi:hypothetical protein
MFTKTFLFAMVFSAMVVGCFCAWLAAEKKRNALAWFALGFLFNFIALIALAGAPAATPKQEAFKLEDDRKTCPFCYHKNSHLADKCANCGRVLIR